MVHHVQTPFFMRAILLYGTAKLALFFFSCKLFANFFALFHFLSNESNKNTAMWVKCPLLHGVSCDWRKKGLSSQNGSFVSSWEQ